MNNQSVTIVVTSRRTVPHAVFGSTILTIDSCSVRRSQDHVLARIGVSVFGPGVTAVSRLVVLTTSRGIRAAEIPVPSHRPTRSRCQVAPIPYPSTIPSWSIIDYACHAGVRWRPGVQQVKNHAKGPYITLVLWLRILAAQDLTCALDTLCCDAPGARLSFDSALRTASHESAANACRKCKLPIHWSERLIKQ